MENRLKPLMYVQGVQVPSHRLKYPEAAVTLEAPGRTVQTPLCLTWTAGLVTALVPRATS